MHKNHQFAIKKNWVNSIYKVDDNVFASQTPNIILLWDFNFFHLKGLKQDGLAKRAEVVNTTRDDCDKTNNQDNLLKYVMNIN